MMMSKTTENECDTMLAPDGATRELTIDVEPSESDSQPLDMLYRINDNPPWYMCITMALQHFMMMCGGSAALPLIICRQMCMNAEDPAQGDVIGTVFFVSGLVTLLQTTFGSRLTIIQGGSFAFLVPTFAILSLPQWKCPESKDVDHLTNISNVSEVNITDGNLYDSSDLWKSRMREIQGAIILSSLLQVVFGLTGVIGFILRYLGPLSIAPTLTLIGLTLFEAAGSYCSGQWGIAILTTVLIILFSQYLQKCYYYTRRKGCHKGRCTVFQLFPVLLAMGIAWLVCAILTYTNVFSSEKNARDYYTRTDSKLAALTRAPWFRFPYPFQWGIPTFSAGAVAGMMGGVLAGIIESVGDYHAAAKLSGAPPPPVHAVNRGILMEGIGCVIAGLWGTGNGTTSYSENIGAINVTKVGSRRVFQVCGAMIMVCGIFGKVGAMFVTIPDPIIGGVVMITFGMVMAVGVSNLQYVNMNQSRNIFIFGFSVFFGLSLSQWLHSNPGVINTGVQILDQLFLVFLSTSMFVGGAIGFILDNTIPGTEEERGLLVWREMKKPKATDQDQEFAFNKDIMSCYDLPIGMKYLSASRIAKYIPICPQFIGGDFAPKNKQVKK